MISCWKREMYLGVNNLLKYMKMPYLDGKHTQFYCDWGIFCVCTCLVSGVVLLMNVKFPWDYPCELTKIFKHLYLNGWQHSRHPVRRHVKKSLFTDIDFHMDPDPSFPLTQGHGIYQIIKPNTNTDTSTNTITLFIYVSCMHTSIHTCIYMQSVWVLHACVDVFIPQIP